MHTKPNLRYFRQYRNPGQDASGKNGTYGHPTIKILFCVLQQGRAESSSGAQNVKKGQCEEGKKYIGQKRLDTLLFNIFAISHL